MTSVFYTASIFENGLMDISFFLDKIIYMLASWTYKIFYIMGTLTLDSDATVQSITSKIYTVLLIFMVFVVSYNMLLYIINPDKINDGSVGASKLIQKIALSLLVIIASPYFFDVLYDVQRDIIEYNVIGTIILGGGGTTESEEGEEGKTGCSAVGINASGDALVADVFSAFIYPSNGIQPSECCNGLSDEIEAEDSVTKDYCDAYRAARLTGSVRAFSDIKDSAKKTDDYQYLAIVSTAAGIFMVIYFLGFCVYLGIRLFKLLALELIAPIPALLDLVPGKDGTLKRWFDTVLSVWAQVFIYQALVFSIVWIATLIPGLLYEVNASVTQAPSGFILLAKVLLIMALFQACREVPKMITEVLGIKGGEGILKAAGLKGFGMAATVAAAPGQMLRGAVQGFKGRKGDGVTGFIGGVAAGISEGARSTVSGMARNTWGMRNANSIKDIRSINAQTNKTLKANTIKRNADAKAHPGTDIPVIGKIPIVNGMAGRAVGRITDTSTKVLNKVSDYTGINMTEYSRMKEIDEVNRQVKSTYNELIVNGIYKKDGIYNQIKNRENELEAYLRQMESGNMNEITIQGKTYQYKDLKDQLDTVKASRATREKQLREEKVQEVVVAQQRIQAILDANQGVYGVSQKSHMLKAILDKDGNYNDDAFLEFADDIRNGDTGPTTSKGKGFEAGISKAGHSAKYIRGQAKAAAANAAKEAQEKAATRTTSDNSNGK